jgi:hypothetical protein
MKEGTPLAELAFGAHEGGQRPISWFDLIGHDHEAT